MRRNILCSTFLVNLVLTSNSVSSLLTGGTFCSRSSAKAFVATSTGLISRQQRGRWNSNVKAVSVDLGDAARSKQEGVDATEALSVPLSFSEMAGMAAKAMNDAYDQGITRQIVRVLLPRDPTSGQLGQYFENDADVDARTENLVLVPPDETWQGGIMQLYRAAAPTCVEILRRFSSNTGNLPPKATEDRSVDESGVDGVGLWMTENVSPEDDVSCFVQPTQETLDSVEIISNQAGKRLVMLMNPQWRNIDDALDSASKSKGIFGNLASFLGGKGEALKRLDDLGFQNVFTLEGYVCKGGNIRLLKIFDSDWGVFAENDSGTEFIKVGTSKDRPTYQDCDKMLEENGISLKYARDIGLAPKL